MVFALAGDSTITSDLAMLSFIPSCPHWMLQAILRTSYHYIQAFLCEAVLRLAATFHLGRAGGTACSRPEPNPFPPARLVLRSWQSRPAAARREWALAALRSRL